jgi:glucose-1-phosphate adenylyltransferase
MGKVSHSVLFAGVMVEEGAVVENAVVMPNTVVQKGAVVRHSIVAEDCVIGPGAVVGDETGGIALIGKGTHLPGGFVVKSGEQIDEDVIAEREGAKA